MSDERKHVLGKPEALILATSIFTIVIILLWVLAPDLIEGRSLSRMLISMVKNANSITLYVIVFVSVLIANASIFIYIPYPLVILIACQSDVNLIILLFVASLAAAIGEITGYIIGSLGKISLSKNEKILANLEKLRWYADSNSKAVYFIVFIYALTPLPDDLVMIPLGLMDFGLLRSFIFCFLGKLALMFILIWGSEFVGILIMATGYSIWSDLIVLWIVVLVIYAMMRVDIQEILGGIVI